MQNWIYSNYEIIINIILTLSAITASIFAGITIWQMKKFRRRDELNNRAIINQSPTIGFLKYSKESADNEVCLKINFENIGNDSAYEIKFNILYLNQKMIRESKKLPESIQGSYFPSFNPIPPKGKIALNIIKRKLKDIGLTEELINETDYIIVKVYYKDQVLEQEYSNIFYWYVDEDGELIEIFEEDYIKLKILSMAL